MFSFYASLFIRIISFNMLFKYTSLRSSYTPPLFWYPLRIPSSIPTFWMNTPKWLMNCVKSMWHSFRTVSSRLLTKSGFVYFAENKTKFYWYLSVKLTSSHRYFASPTYNSWSGTSTNWTIRLSKAFQDLSSPLKSHNPLQSPNCHQSANSSWILPRNPCW